ncbi:hypothetical protein [Clostridium sp. ZS2-4]|uniref:hypothetical protein n=1 Tax=Clostridium sp. ZS2-4 TaxID=2987703 RepID=UPI00227CF5A0|nr:hypothetical protein [Clostridium sp. ZS2-4]MCY6355959.1 hypothetical protein [Clostridium sp. ZS2-4]
MEYSNNGLNATRTLKSMISMIVVGFVLLILLKGIFLLIPVALISWIGYKIIKVIMNKLNEFTGKEDNEDIQTSKIFEQNIDDIFNCKVIDVDYEELKK